MERLSPPKIVEELDKYIVGQRAAKRVVAIALSNRMRRMALPANQAKEIIPSNLLMIGPTGVGKTEIARRVAELIDAPFIKVEATKFTEVGYVGRDVESIIYELVEVSIDRVQETRLREIQSQAEGRATERIIDYLYKQKVSKRRRKARAKQAAGAVAANAAGSMRVDEAVVESATLRPSQAGVGKEVAASPLPEERERLTLLLQEHKLDDELIEIEVESDYEGVGSVIEFAPGMTHEDMREALNEFMDGYKHLTHRRRARQVSVKEAQRILAREEAQRLLDFDQVVDAALTLVQERGVVFIDELDKIVGPRVEVGADVSGEGVQRDLLPIVGGTTVNTRYGPVKTDHMLFIAAGSFQQHKPSELIPELQGRFPLRVELESLGQQELKRILAEPENSLTKQYKVLLQTEGVELVFAEDGIAEVARLAALMNERMENIGARRLQTIMEKTLEDISFNASEHKGEQVVVDAAYVDNRLGDLIKQEDLSKYIL